MAAVPPIEVRIRGAALPNWITAIAAVVIAIVQLSA